MLPVYTAPTLERNLIFHRARVVVVAAPAAGQIGVLILGGGDQI